MRIRIIEMPLDFGGNRHGSDMGPSAIRYSGLLEKMSFRFNEREDELKKLDEERLCNKDWYKGNSIVGMMLYTEAFAGNLKGVRKKLDYIEECKVNYIHLMPLLDTPKTKNDGGYAVSDFRKVREDPSAKVVAILPDGGEKYMSLGIYD